MSLDISSRRCRGSAPLGSRSAGLRQRPLRAGGGRGGGSRRRRRSRSLTLEQKPIEQTSEFIATVRSLRSTTVQPEVDGLVTRIFVKSGDRVRAGAPLVQIDADKQQATVRSTEANRAGTEADVQYWRQQVKRLEALVAAGAISRQEFDQAQNSLRTAEARLAALDAQVREGQRRARSTTGSTRRRPASSATSRSGRRPRHARRR